MMEEKKITGRIRAPGPTNDGERQRVHEIRKKALEEFPPRDQPRLRPVVTGIGAQIRSARESQGLTWYSLAEKAGVPTANIVRDIEYGRETTLANIEAVVAALGLKLKLVEHAS